MLEEGQDGQECFGAASGWSVKLCVQPCSASCVLFSASRRLALRPRDHSVETVTSRCRRCCESYSHGEGPLGPFWFISLDVEAQGEDQESSYFKLGLKFALCIVYNEYKMLCSLPIECEIVAIMAGRMPEAELAVAETHTASSADL